MAYGEPLGFWPTIFLVSLFILFLPFSVIILLLWVLGVVLFGPNKNAT